jgi:hypothetical protein
MPALAVPPLPARPGSSHKTGACARLTAAAAQRHALGLPRRPGAELHQHQRPRRARRISSRHSCDAVPDSSTSGGRAGCRPGVNPATADTRADDSATASDSPRPRTPGPPSRGASPFSRDAMRTSRRLHRRSNCFRDPADAGTSLRTASSHSTYDDPSSVSHSSSCCGSPATASSRTGPYLEICAAAKPGLHHAYRGASGQMPTRTSGRKEVLMHAGP